MLFVGMTATYAQVPDASSWKVGDEITDQIGWGNLTFDQPDFTPWHLESSKGSFTKSAGLFEVYDGADVDLYQYVELPAGMYKVEAQAYYRFGNSWAEDPSKYNTDDWQDLAQMYVSNGIYSVDDDAFTATRTFQTPVMPRLFDASDTQLYVDEVKDPWDKSDNTITLNGNTVYAPASVEGSLAYFNAGKFAPYDDGDGTKYNTVTFFLTEPGYARVGIKKTEAKEADSFMATNFKMYYLGEAGEAAEVAALQDEVQVIYNKLAALSEKHDNGLFYTLCSDDVMAFDEEYPQISEMTKDECVAAKAKLNDIYTRAVKAEGYISKIEDIIPNMEALAKKGYPGQADFEAAIEAAKKCVDPDYEATDEDSYESFENSYNALLNARMPYLLSQTPNEDGSINLSSLISYPWFCLPEYEPTYNAETGKWEPNQDAIDMRWTEGDDSKVIDPGAEGYEEGNLLTWGKKDDCSGTKFNIAKDINVYNALGTENAWAQGGDGSNLEVHWNDQLTCLKKWSMVTEGEHEISQVLTNVPNGWYSLTALGQTWSNDWSGNCHCRVFLESGSSKEESTYVTPGGWWGTNIDQWQELTTSMVHVSDGRMKIGSYDNGFWAVTGFQLKYYGASLNYDYLLTEDLSNVKANIESLAWAGDKAAANAILADVPAEVKSEEAFLKAKEVIKKTNEYVSAANAVVNSFKAADNFFQLADSYASKLESEDVPEYKMLMTAWAYAMTVGEAETDTYLDAVKANNTYDAYKSYLDYRDKLGDMAKNAAIKTVIDEQDADLVDNVADADKLVAYQGAIALAYNKISLADKNLDKATENNPVDITELITNPGFEEGNSGWTGNMTNAVLDKENGVYFGVPEIYNLKVDVSQTIYSLPAGYYRIDCQAFYRDGGDANASFKHWQESAWDMEIWGETDYAKLNLYANSRSVKVRPLGSELPTEPMMKYVDNGNWSVDDPQYTEQDPDKMNYAYPWDTKVEDGEDVFYYPNSIYGTKNLFTNHPDFYHNEVVTYVPEGGNLTFGLKKSEVIGGDWTMFDNFKLYYLGTATPTGIDAAQADGNASKAEAIYTISGVQTNAMGKGINIIKMADGTVKKVVK